MKDILALCMRTVSGKRKLHLRQELDRRLMAFHFPSGWERFTFHMLRTVTGNHSMELFRRASTICIHIFQGMFLFRNASGWCPTYPDDYPDCFSYVFLFFFRLQASFPLTTSSVCAY